MAQGEIVMPVKLNSMSYARIPDRSFWTTVRHAVVGASKTAHSICACHVAMQILTGIQSLDTKNNSFASSPEHEYYGQSSILKTYMHP